MARKKPPYLIKMTLSRYSDHHDFYLTVEKKDVESPADFFYRIQRIVNSINEKE